MNSVMEPTQGQCSQARTAIKPPKADDLMAVVRHYQGPLLRYVGHMTGRLNHEAEDLVQEVFLRLHRQVSRKGSNSIENLTTWLYRVAHNVTLDALRRSHRQSKHKDSLEDVVQLAREATEEIDALGEAIRQEARQVALQELNRLAPEHRQVVLLKIIQDMSLRQVAEVVGVSLSTVNYRLNQGMVELTHRLKKAGVV